MDVYTVHLHVYMLEFLYVSKDCTSSNAVPVGRAKGRLPLAVSGYQSVQGIRGEVYILNAVTIFSCMPTSLW